MKKLFLFLTLSFILSVGHSQVMMDAVSATVTATYDAGITNTKKIGVIVISTPASFNGTTSTAVLSGGVRNSSGTITWASVYQDDNITACSFTLATNSQYAWIIRATVFDYYRITYTKGDATAGTVTAILSSK